MINVLVNSAKWVGVFTFYNSGTGQDFSKWCSHEILDGAPFSIRTQSAITCSKLAIETLEEGVKYVQS